MKKLTTHDGEVLTTIEQPAIFWKTPHNHNTEAVTRSLALTCPEKTLTQQHQAEEANINTIVEKFGLTGQLPQIPLPPTLDDFGEIFDFQSAMETMLHAKNSFAQLPAHVREAFSNDPHRFVSQVDLMLAEENPDARDLNLRNLRALGLVVDPGPVADKTSLGDLLQAIKAQGTPQTPSGDSPAPKGSETAS